MKVYIEAHWLNYKGKFKVKASHLRIFNETLVDDIGTSKWHQNWKLFLCELCQNLLPGKSNLFKKKIGKDPLCPVCKQETDAIQYRLLFMLVGKSCLVLVSAVRDREEASNVK